MPPVCVRVGVCVCLCLFWGFTSYLRPIFTQQPQGEITSFSPTQLCFLNVSMATAGTSHRVYPSARERERREGKGREENQRIKQISVRSEKRALND